MAPRPLPSLFLSEELIENLEERFPDRGPRIHQTEREIWMDAGAAFVVRFLRQEFERQRQEGIIGVS